MSVEPVYQRDAVPESPAIHVVLAPGVDSRLFRWVEVGAEEEGVPCRLAPASTEGLAAATYEAAQASRLGVGVGVGAEKVLLHEAHMPVGQPVWEWPSNGTPAEVCRLAGCNAGRFVKRMPLRLEEVEPVVVGGAPATGEPAAEIQAGTPPAAIQDVAAPDAVAPDAVAPEAIIQAIARVLERRGLA